MTGKHRSHEETYSGDFTSDLFDPEWLTASDNITPSLGSVSEMDFGHQDTGHPGIRTVHGFRDFMHEIHEELQEWEERGEKAGEVPEFLRKILGPFPDPVYVNADINPARAFHTDSFVVPALTGGIPQGLNGGATLLSARGDRTRIVITNTGAANPLLISFTDDVDGVQTLGASAWITVPNGALPGNPREIRAGGKIYAYSPLGTTCDIQEEYGFIHRVEGRFLNP